MAKATQFVFLLEGLVVGGTTVVSKLVAQATRFNSRKERLLSVDHPGFSSVESLKNAFLCISWNKATSDSSGRTRPALFTILHSCG
jgi:hypothetical protein